LHRQDFVVKLTDATFEHETQASTGGTTGSWLVWFHSKKDNTPIAGEVPPPEFWTDNHVVLATVDAKANPSTRSRFGLMYKQSKLPCFVFIHKGKYYKLKEPPKGYVFNWDKISHFALEGYAIHSEGQDIPPPRTTWDEVQEFFEQAYDEFGGMYFTSMVYFILFMAGLAVIQNVFNGYTKNIKKAKED